MPFAMNVEDRSVMLDGISAGGHSASGVAMRGSLQRRQRNLVMLTGKMNEARYDGMLYLWVANQIVRPCENLGVRVARRKSN